MKFDKFGKLGQLKMPDLKNSVGKLKERWKSQPGKTKKLVAAIGGGILCTAVLMAVVVGNSTGKYKVPLKSIRYIETYKRNLMFHTEQENII